MLVDKIIEQSKNQPVIVYFDMDGTIAELNIWDTPKVVKNEPGFYIGLRPLKCVLGQIKRLSKQKNVTIGLISYCHYPNQKQDKLIWLDKYVKFVDKQNVHIIVLSQTPHTADTKDYLKAQKLQQISSENPGVPIYFVEDDKDVMRATHNTLNNVQVVHVTAFVK